MPRHPKKLNSENDRTEKKVKKRKRKDEDGTERRVKRQNTSWLRDIKAILRSATEKSDRTSNSRDIKFTGVGESVEREKVTGRSTQVESKGVENINGGSVSTGEEELQKVEYELDRNDITLENDRKTYSNRADRKLKKQNSDGRNNSFLTGGSTTRQVLSADDNLNSIEVLAGEWMNVDSRRAQSENLPDYDTLLSSENTFVDAEEMNGCDRLTSNRHTAPNENIFYFGQNENSYDNTEAGCFYTFAEPAEPDRDVGEERTSGYVDNSNSSSVGPRSFGRDPDSDNREGNDLLNDPNIRSTEGSRLPDPRGIETETPEAYYDSRDAAYVHPSTLTDESEGGSAAHTIKRTWGSIKNIISMVSGQKNNLDDTKDSTNEQDGNQSYDEIQY